eukprot:8994931-Pyramimonas_sp.AAC.1
MQAPVADARDGAAAGLPAGLAGHVHRADPGWGSGRDVRAAACSNSWRRCLTTPWPVQRVRPLHFRQLRALHPVLGPPRP